LNGETSSAGAPAYVTTTTTASPGPTVDKYLAAFAVVSDASSPTAINPSAMVK
jgi:hypothetical protein